MQGRFTILWYYLRTRIHRPFPDRERLLAWQDSQVRQFLTRILPHSPFYRRFYAGLEIQNWQNFPIIDKTKMMANFADLNTAEITTAQALQIALAAEETRDFTSTIGNITVGLSSGTSGTRGLFLVSPHERFAWAGTLLAKVLPQSLLTPQRIAFFLRANSNLYQTVENKQLRFQFFDLLDPIAQHLEQLNQYAPTLLVAPPSLLLLLAEAKLAGKLNINPIKIIAVAEVLDPLDAQSLQQVFGQMIHQVYQCTEGFLAVTCPYGTLHLNEDIVAIQKDYVDGATDKFMPIITDFSRTTQPIIRYRLDDILTERKVPCCCGSLMTAIDQIEGRRDDIFYLKSVSRESLVPIFPDFIRRAIIGSLDNSSNQIQAYQVIQKSSELIEVKIKAPLAQQSQIQANVSKALIALFERSNCQVPYLIYGDEIDYDPRQKLRRIRREFSVAESR